MMTEKQFLDINQEEGLEPVSDTHRPMLWLALNLTKESDLPVGEFGAGHGSTEYLRKYCLSDLAPWEREFYSYDNNKDWAKKWDSYFIGEDWANPELYIDSSVVLVDQAPGEARRISIEKLKDKALIIVVHDVEPENNGSYRLDLTLGLFKYAIVIKGPKIWTAALSNHINLDDLVGSLVGGFEIEKLDQKVYENI